MARAFEFRLYEMPPGQSAIVILPGDPSAAAARAALEWRFGPDRVESVREHVPGARRCGQELEQLR